MTLGRLLVRSLFYHWRGNLAVLLGVAVGTAVLTGALVVGDSLRGSLRDRALGQLGWVDQALVAGRFFGSEDLTLVTANGQCCPALILQGAATAETPGGGHAGRVTILGVDDCFWSAEHAWGGTPAPMERGFWSSADAGVVLSKAVAQELGVATGQKVTLHLQKSTVIPHEFVLGRQGAAETLDRVLLTVREILPGDSFGDRFSLTPSVAAPRNVWVPRRTLQAAVKPPLKDGVNAILVGSKHSASPQSVSVRTEDLQKGLAERMTLDDWGLVLRDPEQRARAFFDSLDRNHRGRLRGGEWPRLRDEAFRREIDRNGDGAVDREEMTAFYRTRHPYLVLESRRLFVEPAVAEAAMQASVALGMRAAPTLVYLADSIAGSGKEMPYAIVAALDPSLAPPLGPFLPPGASKLADDQVVLLDWPGSPLPRALGEVVLTYYGPEENDQLHRTGPMGVRGWLPIAGAADDPDLTPPFPGITDQASLAGWDPPPAMHYQPRRVRPVDEAYWRSYRTTPKAYVTLAKGQVLWGSRFDNLTSVRVAPNGDGPLPAGMAERWTHELLARLKPEQGGMVFRPVRAQALAGSAGSADFGGLFLAFSLFLIVAALLLVGLLFRLNLDRRAAEAGVLLAMGLRRRTLRRLLWAEGGLVALAGGLVGLAGAVLYAWAMLDLLRRWWPGGLDQSFLRLHITAMSLVIGYAASLLVSVLTIAWAVRLLGRVPPRALLAGETSEPPADATVRPARWVRWAAAGLILGALGCMAAGAAAGDAESRAGGFFGSGVLLLAAGLAAVWLFLRRGAARPGRHVATVGVRNAGRHPGRSLLTAGLLAAATFLVVAVQSFRQEPGRDFLAKDGGSGGFALLAEADVPIFLDPQSQRGRADLDDALEQAQVPAAERARVLADTVLFPFRLRAGEDTSCLNLYQPGRPRLLGAPTTLIERGGFRFQRTLAPSAVEKDNPWRLLEGKHEDGPVPVFAATNTAEWILHKGLGDTLEVPDENGQPRALRLVGLLDDSIFQSELVLGEADFRRLFPHEEGYRYFLVQTPPAQAGEVKRLLERALADHGLTVTPTRQRLEAYLAVENTYLSTFQALGGLGVLLGSLGLGVVLLRGVWERRGELALLRALGFRRRALGWLVLAENGWLLGLGVGAGAAAALVAVAPHLATGTGAVPWGRLLGFLAVVLAVGLAAGGAAVMMTLRAPLVPALRRE